MDKSYDIEFSRNLKTCMEDKGVNAKSLAEYLHIRPSSFSDMMTNRSPWRLTYIARLSLYFGISTDRLIFGSENVSKNYMITQLRDTKDEFLAVAEKKGTYSAVKKIVEGIDDEIKKISND